MSKSLVTPKASLPARVQVVTVYLPFQTGIAIPKANYNPRNLAATKVTGPKSINWQEMQVGQSIFINTKKSVASRYARQTVSKKFVTRTVLENGVTGKRVWRVK